jgi:hypothetical protein
MDAGHITICLGQGIAIRSTRPANIGAIFAGKNVADVARLMPLLFAVCGRAQGEASRLALAMARGEQPDPALPAAVTAEAIREHLMRMAVDWAKTCGVVTDTSVLRRIHALPRRAGEVPSLELAGEAQALLAELAADAVVIRAGNLEAVLSGRTIAARLLRLVTTRGLSDWGHGEADLGETSAFTLVRGHAAMAPLLADHGDGLLSRLYARPLHVAVLIETLAGRPAQALLRRQGEWGEATVPTSRGLLTHRARRDGDQVTAYEISAPTDINFNPQGIAACRLGGTHPSTDDFPLRLFVEALDPCVTYSISAEAAP